MEVLFDHQIFINQKIGGISRYITDLKRGFDQLPGTNSKIVACLSNNLYLKQGKPYTKLPFSKRTARMLNSLLIKKGFIDTVDIIHPTYYNIRYLAKAKKPIIITVHDLIYFKYPQYFADFKKIKRQFSYAINRCNGIICISENTRKELNNYFDIQDKAVTVIHHGVELKSDNYSEKILSEKNNYFLYIGSRSLYKNFRVLLESFIKVIKNYSTYKLLVIGGEQLSEDEKVIFDKYSDNLKHIPFVTDYDLANLYKSSLALIVTSLDEGFCYPVVEALLAGTNVICSQIDVLKEVAGKYAYYFNAHNPNELVDLIIEIIERNGSRMKEVDEKFRQYYKLERMCNDTRKFYDTFK